MRNRRLDLSSLGLLLALSLLVKGVYPLEAGAGDWTLVGWNDLGMHCMDGDYAVFSILPPFNTIQAHLIDDSGNLVTSRAGLSVTYEGIADPDGSINVTSAGKTNFWDHVEDLFGVPLPVDEGLTGNTMPGVANVPQAMSWQATHDWFAADGIPITPYDEDAVKNYYPMMRLVARDAGGQLLAETAIVLPVSDEMDCSACHASGSEHDAEPSDGWIWDPDPERDYRLNILLLHDDRNEGSAIYTAALATMGYDSGGLYPTVVDDDISVLCAGCHASNALPGTGIAGIPPLTTAVHGFHAYVDDPQSGLPLDSSDNRAACYRCHPGSETRCLRGAMGKAVAADGSLAIQCQDCHGTMSAVGEETRVGWLDQPNCQSCHTGTATDNNGQIRYTSVFEPTGEVRQAVNQTFATDPDAPTTGFSLYRFSFGHGGLSCLACHGSTHAVFPTSHANDNLRNEDLQGHEGTLVECVACHATTPNTVSGGPHGLHPVGETWIEGHKAAADSDSIPCQDCHGTDYKGTVLSYSQADWVAHTGDFGDKHFWRGFRIGCHACHDGPDSESPSPNHPAVVQDDSAAADAGVAVEIPLAASDQDSDPLTLRIVSQPTYGTVALDGATATYLAFEGFSGVDGFTFAAWDGWTDSNLGTVTVMVTASRIFADGFETGNLSAWSGSVP
jgi:hypothetical protein